MGVVVFIVLLLVASALASGAIRSAAKNAELQTRHRQAEQRIDGEFSRTKRAMNDAAGQSWRNLVD
jgi:type II secretory pathway pseudopilin PulG